MIRGLLAAALLVLAAPAIAQPAAPALHDLTGEFDRFATETEALPIDERVRLFRARFQPLLPGFYEPRYGKTSERYNAEIAGALTIYPAMREKFLATARGFDAAYQGASLRFRRFFPDYAPTIPIYLVHSLGQMDGGTRDLPGGIAGIFGADVIARIHDPASIGPFLDHELFHFHHARFFADCPQLWCTLWQEGLAVYVAATLNPGADDRALLLTIPQPIRETVEPRLAEVFCYTRARLDSTSQEDSAEFFQVRKAGKAFPPRFGYYVGYRIAQRLGEKRSLRALAELQPAQVRPLIEAALAGQCRPA